MKFLCALVLLCGLRAWALDREAFTFTKYDLHVRIEPEQQRLGVRGTITVRNDSDVPQQNLSLQISSSLTWRSIQLNHEPVEFLPQSYTSDIDHTGSLSEAIITLPKAIPPKGLAELSVGYEGTISSDATRLTRIGVPENAAKDTDWDEISNAFTAVRGIGYVTWYPIAEESANLSQGTVFPTIERWKSRHHDSSMTVIFDPLPMPVFFSGARSSDLDLGNAVGYTIPHFGVNVPVFAAADYKSLGARNGSSVNYLRGSEDAAKSYASLLGKLQLPSFFRSEGDLQVLQLPNKDGAPFVSDSILLTPMTLPISTDVELNTVYALARQTTISERLWIQDGLAHYAQLHHIEKAGGRTLVLAYLGIRRSLLAVAPKGPEAEHEAASSLINSGDDPKSQMKAMWIWWMLRDMCGEDAISQAMDDYKPASDKEPSYMQHLLQTACKKDLEWFFDDWVYRDKGLPDFHIATVFPRKNLKEGFLTTVTVENLGNAAAEVPVTLHDASGDFAERLLIKGKSQASIRFSTTNLPDQVVVNDGSVPESDFNNNTFKIEAEDAKPPQ